MPELHLLLTWGYCLFWQAWDRRSAHAITHIIRCLAGIQLTLPTYFACNWTMSQRGTMYRRPIYREKSHPAFNVLFIWRQTVVTNLVTTCRGWRAQGSWKGKNWDSQVINPACLGIINTLLQPKQTSLRAATKKEHCQHPSSLPWPHSLPPLYVL